MDKDKLHKAMDGIDDKYLKEAAGAKKRSRPYWLGAVAAALAVAILAGAFLIPREPQPTVQNPTVNNNTEPARSDYPAIPQVVLLENRVASPVYPEMVARPTDNEDYAGENLWRTALNAQRNQPEGYADNLQDFFAGSMAEFLSGSGDENAVCSPLNIYMALAMLAETTGGNSREQILSALGSDSIEALRTQAGHVWNAHYLDDGTSKSLLANSLWLDESRAFYDSTVKTLADSYYASVFHGDLGGELMNEALRGWLNENTGGLLSKQVESLSMPPETALALASTIYFQGSWHFSADLNTQETFHGSSGDVTATFMNETLHFGTLYRGEDFTAVSQSISEGNKMWFILPNKGTTPLQLLEADQASELVLGGYKSWKDKQTYNIHFSVPKFDVSAKLDLREGLENMGISDVFSEQDADFSAVTPDWEDLYLGKAEHAARLVIDEEGALGAAYTVMLMYATGAVQQPPKEIDFTLDRPFLFVITSQDDLPLFAGIVNQV